MPCKNCEQRCNCTSTQCGKGCECVKDCKCHCKDGEKKDCCKN
ncbi:CLUMA_CG011229, isoform A [Clunio marinus]|uniref:CLUMA_CG011229, isoform A n=1 Tax=Clunio marinus TaxID=568069 RepID=A0A1J1IFQ2_9DIPT|nr:CLUMA_CG011229, isoform A [Clunio marinus]